MRAIKPVHLNQKGDEVSNLHKGLLFLILHQPGISDNDRRTLQQRLAPELRDQTFGNATLDLVRTWQVQLKHRPDAPKNLRDNLAVNGDVEQGTADALNWLLAELGALKLE